MSNRPPADQPDLSDREYRAMAQFRSSLRQYFRTVEQAARRSGLTPAQHQLLLAVRGFEEDRPPSVSELADRLQLQVHSVLELVQRAQAAGLVERQDDAKDGRRHLVRLTEAGARNLADLHQTHRAELDSARTVILEALRRLDESG